MSIAISLNISRGDVKAGGDLTVEEAVQRHVDLTQEIGITAEAVNLGDIAVAEGGWAYFQNLGVNNIALSTESDGATPFALLKPNEYFAFRLHDTQIYAIATSAATDMRVIIFQE